MLYFMIISGAFLVGVAVNSALMNTIRNLLRDTEEMEDTDNSFLKQMKLRYKNCMRIGHEIRNTEAFAGKYMDKYTNYGLSFAAFEKSTKPMINITAMTATPAICTPVSLETPPTSAVPIKEAPFPQIS